MLRNSKGTVLGKRLTPGEAEERGEESVGMGIGSGIALQYGQHSQGKQNTIQFRGREKGGAKDQGGRGPSHTPSPGLRKTNTKPSSLRNDTLSPKAQVPPDKT